MRSPSYTPGTVKRIAVSAFTGPNKETGAAIADSLIPDLIEMDFGGVMAVAHRHNILEFESLSARLVSVQSGEILLSAARRTSFDAEDLGDVLEDISNSLKKNLQQ
ncbi:MAG: hypothetical protein LDLANPLL_00578 [Turneriella sp.]|nr:hypothetical protein [Turneriella sp.]